MGSLCHCRPAAASHPARGAPRRDPRRLANDEGTLITSGEGGDAALQFAGTGIALADRLTQDRGHADVFIDGKKQKQPADADIVERTSDQDLWHLTGLKSGDHTLGLVSRADADPRSQGWRIAISRAIVYRAK